MIKKAKFQLLDMKNDSKDEVDDESDACLWGILKANADCDQALVSVSLEYEVPHRAKAENEAYNFEGDVFDDDPAAQLSYALSSLMELADVTLVFGDQELACHKAILMTRSIYFRSLLSASGGFRESGKERYEYEEPFDLFQKMIQFLYDGTIRDEDLTPVCLDLIPMADQYLVEDLKAACELLACSPEVITSANALDALFLAYQCNCDKLFRFCVPIFRAEQSALTGSEK